MSWLEKRQPVNLTTNRSDHLLAVGEVVERTLLVDDAHGGLLGSDADALDVVRGLAHRLQLVVNNVGGFNRGLSVELGGVRDLEQNILHDIGGVRHRKLERLALNTSAVSAFNL